MADSGISTTVKEASRELRSKFLERVCTDMYNTQMSSKTKKLPWGYVSKILNEAKIEEPWITKNKLYFAFKKFCTKKDSEEKELLDSSKCEATINKPCCNGGRPKGSTIENQYHQKETFVAAKNEIFSLYLFEKEKRTKNSERVPKGWLKSTIESVIRSRGLPSTTTISVKSIRKRTKPIVLTQQGCETLMYQVEPQLVTLILAMAQARRCLQASECISLANDLIKGSDLEKKIIERKKKIMEVYDDDTPVLGKKYWQLFNRRWKHKLVSRRGQKFAIDRSNSLTYRNVKKMYDDVYSALVESGNAIKTQQCTSKYDGILKTHYHLIHPQNCLVVDEVGSDTSQKGDGHIAGAKYYCGRGWVPQNQSSSNDKHFTMLGFTALSGEPVMCLIIIAGVQEKWEVECGINVDAVPVGDPTDPDFFQKNTGKGKMFPLGPECTFRGKKVPTMVRWSQSGSITSIILRDALATMDHYELFERTSNRRPFLLLDGHHSRFEVQFLKYVTDADHPWMICIGVPYGTSLWQVADSKEQNGSFKIAISKAKSNLLKKRLDMYMDSPGIYPTDIMTIVNDAWQYSFDRIELNKKAIYDRGWGPLNYNLLNDKDIQATMTDLETVEYASMLKSPSDQSTISDLTDEDTGTKLSKNIPLNFDQKYLTKVITNSVSCGTNLNFSTGRAADVARRLIHDHDIREAREANQKLASKGKEAKQKLESAKKLTAMLNFNTIGCQVGEDSLKIRLEMAKKKKQSDERVQKKKDEIVNERKRKYHKIQDDIRAKNIPISQLTIAQLKQLCNYKKRKDDKVSISKLKREELQQLWLIWKDRCNDDDDLEALLKNKSASEESHASISTSMSDTDKAVVTCDRNAAHDTCNEGRHIDNENKIMNDGDFLII